MVYLKQVAATFTGVPATNCVVVIGNPAAVIVDIGRRRKQRMLIAMTTHGRSGINRWLLGSVADWFLMSGESLASRSAT